MAPSSPKAQAQAQTPNPLATISSAGGCDLHPTWALNPKYVLEVEERCRVRIGLRRIRTTGGGVQIKGGHQAALTLKDMIGFYVLRAPLGAGTEGGPRLTPKHVVCETSFVPMDDVDIEVDLRPMKAHSHIIMPCTYAPFREAKFELTVTALVKFKLSEYLPQGGAGKTAKKKPPTTKTTTIPPTAMPTSSA